MKHYPNQFLNGKNSSIDIFVLWIQIYGQYVLEVFSNEMITSMCCPSQHRTDMFRSVFVQASNTQINAYDINIIDRLGCESPASKSGR